MNQRTSDSRLPESTDLITNPLHTDMPPVIRSRRESRLAVSNSNEGIREGEGHFESIVPDVGLIVNKSSGDDQMGWDYL